MVFKKQSKEHSERGQAILELAIILPFLVLVMVGIGDLARAMTRYTAYVSIARDGANYASRILNLSPGTVTATGDSISNLTPVANGHALTLYRIRTAISLWDHDISMDDVNLTSTYDSANQTVTAIVSVRMKPIFGLYSAGYSVKARSTFPYVVASGLTPGLPPPNSTPDCTSFLKNSWKDGSSSMPDGAGGQYGMIRGGDSQFFRGAGENSIGSAPNKAADTGPASSKPEILPENSGKIGSTQEDNALIEMNTPCYGGGTKMVNAPVLDEFL